MARFSCSDKTKRMLHDIFVFSVLLVLIAAQGKEETSYLSQLAS